MMRKLFVYSFALLTVVVGVLLGCQDAQSRVEEGSDRESAPAPVFGSVKSPQISGFGLEFVLHDNYLAMALPVEALAPLVNDIRARSPRPLLTRGEAHVTVVTPPEFERIRNVITIGDLNRIARNHKIQESPIVPICIGRGEAKKDGVTEQTYFMVVDSGPFLKVRQSIRNLLDRRGAIASVFIPEDYRAHITLAYTKADLHETDGVMKDRTSCWNGYAFIQP